MKTYNEQPDEAKQTYAAFLVKGDSMSDETRNGFEDGSKIMTVVMSINDLKDAVSKNPAELWVIEVGNSILFRQIILYDQVNNTIVCHPLNADYKDTIIDLANISKVYKVVNKIVSY